MDAEKFKKIVWEYYRKHGRYDLPWRKTKDPYKILVSEMMLQQTQVARVIPKYESWMKKFPNLRMLAKASIKDVLKEWQGLGYNRRALYLKKTAEKLDLRARSLSEAHKRENPIISAVFPSDLYELQKFPGIGQSTAGAIMAFAYNQPVVFIETNIRSVFIHHFFPKARKVSDEKIIPLIEKTVDRKNPREWYYALMDYGVYLKSTGANPSRKSKHHTKQLAFKGSNRELRAHILREIISKPCTEKEVIKKFPKTPHDITKILSSLVTEGFIVKNKISYTIKK